MSPAPSGLPLTRVRGARDLPLDQARWPGTLAAVAQLLTEGLDLGPLTVLVGENGSGKSTLVEAIALAYGMSPEGGSTGARSRTRETESELWKHVALERGIGGSHWGFFMRAETMHGFYSYLEQNPNPRSRDPVFHEMSHGESFLGILNRRFSGPGLYLLDEPESALSFTGCLSLVGLLTDLAASGNAQAIIATHSPLIAATPGARVYEVGDWGLRECPWAELGLTQDWRSFLQDPDRYLRHLR
ncbi:MAG: ATPase [Frankiales bacterium]|nr:ATPase [Frankiales bacterium]